MKYFSYLFLIFIAEYVLGTLLVVGFSYLLFRNGLVADQNNNIVAIFLTKIILLLFIVLIVNKVGGWNLSFQFPKIKIILLCVILAVIYFTIHILIINQGFNLKLTFDLYNRSYIYLFTVILFGPIYEEIFYRAFGMEYLKRYGSTNSQAMWFTAIVFALIHLPVMPQTVNGLFLGLACSYLYIRFKSIIYPIIFHIVFNFLTISIIPLG